MKSDSVILLSGGQDSTTCLYWALSKGFNPFCVIVDYGQSHKVEVDYAIQSAEKNNLEYEIVSMKNVLKGSSLVEEGDHNSHHFLSDELPASFTPHRNLLLLTVAANRAAIIGSYQIITGVCQTDYSGYPDCRREFLDVAQSALKFSIGTQNDFQIIAPLMNLNKAETWKLAHDLGALAEILHFTMTDYNGKSDWNYWGYGDPNSPSSKLRKKGWEEAVKLGYIPGPDQEPDLYIAQ